MENQNEYLTPKLQEPFVIRNDLVDAFTIVTEDNENMFYLILYVGSKDSDKEDVSGFELVQGREAAYKFIISIAEDIDVHESKILSEKMNIKELNDNPEECDIYTFCVAVEHRFGDLDFNIRDYSYKK